ncbi:MAG: HD domain-containing protein [Nanoarchaeota archaeon]
MEGIEIIRYSPVLQDGFRYIIENSTSNYMPYHNLNHLLTVLKYSDFIANGEGVYYDQRLPLHLAALFHDVDHSGGEFKDDGENIKRASAAFRKFSETTSEKISQDTVQKVVALIEATQYPYIKPHSALESRLQHIIRDADLMQQFEYNWIGQATLGLAKEGDIPIKEFIPKQRLFLEEIKFLTKTANEFKEKNWSKIMNEFRILEVSMLL